MKSSQNAPAASNTDKRVFYVSLAVFIGTLVMLFLLNNRASFAPTPADSAGQPGQRMTLEPQVLANLTDFPSAPPLTGERAEQMNLLQTRLNACSDYSSERRSQMQQHIDWLLEPSTIPRDILIALGAHPNGRLIFGMASYTSIEWSLRDKAAASCLLPIGQMLNAMLVAEGEPPVPEFE